MIRNLCLIFVVCLAVILVKSESTIEVDENGDEYDVKKFHIQGRQLNEGSSQCVVTRRKRATQPQPLYSPDYGINDEVEDEINAYINKGEEQQAILFYSPTAVSATATEDGDDGKQNEESDININEMNKNKEEEELTNSMQEGNQNGTEENIVEMAGDKQKEENDTLEIIQLHQLPVLGHLQSDGEAVTAMTSVPNADSDNNNGIVVVQSIEPPKVNPQTHAVFKLVPVMQNGADADEDQDVENAGGDYNFEEELSPITTTAIWSTGDDSLNDFFNNYDLQPVKNEKNVKKYKKPLKNNNKKRKTVMKTKRRNKYNNSFRRGLKKHNKKNENNKRFQNGNSVQTPVRRRGPHKNNVNMMMRDQTNKRKRNYKSKNSIPNKKRRYFNTRNKFITKKNKNKNKADIIDQGVNTVTKTISTTQTGNEDGEKKVNCIIIRKDPPPTTPRPFWNLLGRSANGAPQASGHFGNRKRVNIRFVA